MLLISVTATAGMPAAATDLISGLTRTSPSTRENSVCKRRWTNEAVMAVLYKTQKRQGRDCTTAAAHERRQRTQKNEGISWALRQMSSSARTGPKERR